MKKMEVQMSDNIVAERDDDGTWYLRDTITNLVSREYFISVEILQKCLGQGYEVTWVEEERGVLQGKNEALGIDSIFFQ